MSKFKVGDKVVCVKGDSLGTVENETYEISFIEYFTCKLVGSPYWYDSADFKLKSDTEDVSEYTGSSVSYYKVEIKNPTSADILPYTVECNDLIEALGCNFAEGNVLKALFRKCIARKYGLHKKGYDDGKYDSEKMKFFIERIIKMECENGN